MVIPSSASSSIAVFSSSTAFSDCTIHQSLIAGLVFGIPYFDLHAVGVDLFLYDFTIVGACREGCVGSVDLNGEVFL